MCHLVLGSLIFILLGFCSVSWICRFMVFCQFGEFSDTITLNTFPLPPLPQLSPLFARLWWHQCSIFCYGPKSVWVSVHFFFHVYFCSVFRWGSLFCSVFKFTHSFLSLLNTSVKLIHWVLILILYFLVLNFPLDSPLYPLLLGGDFLFFHLFELIVH